MMFDAFRKSLNKTRKKKCQTSSTQAQKWSRAFGWMSPQVKELRKFSFGKGSFSLLTK
jgi:hypothetical protein